MRLASTLAVASIALFASGRSGTLAEDRVELRRLFPQEADVFVDRPGLSRLALPEEVLAACRPDLSDLRLFDRDEREVAFLVDRAPSPTLELKVTRRIEPRLHEVRRTEVRRETGPPLRRESFEIEPARNLLGTGGWVLALETRRPEFVARVSIESVAASGSITPLIDDGSFYRLEGPRRAERVRLALPASTGDRLRIVLETEEPFWLEPSFHLERASGLERPERIAVRLEVAATTRSGNRTVVDLLRPRGIVPDQIRIETSTATFDRKVEIRDVGPGSAGGTLGAGRAFRIEALVPLAELDIELLPARGNGLRLEIEDGDSPGLEDLVFAAVIHQPSLIFALDGSGRDRAAGTLRFGGARARAPRYDLAGLLPSTAATGKRAEAAALLYDPDAVGTAGLGRSRANAAFDHAPALAFALRPGAEIDRGVFSHLRPVRIAESPEGLSYLLLGADDLALLGDGLADLRIADERGRQWPFLIERNAADERVPLAVRGPESRDGTSHYRLELPFAPLQADRILVSCDEPYFDRPFRLTAVLSDREQILAQGRLVRPIGTGDPTSIALRPERARSLSLEIEDGDDAPLAIRSAVAGLTVPALYVTAPAGSYSLLLGAPDSQTPRYELDRVRNVVLAVNATRATTGALQKNPDASVRARLTGTGLGPRVLLWAVLIAAVVVLVATTVRVARRDS